jgi:hypothetical protein
MNLIPFNWNLLNISESSLLWGAVYENYPKEKTIVSLTRIEPPLHPAGPEKVLVDFGIEPEEFREDDFLTWYNNTHLPSMGEKTTEGIFAPWAFYKSEFEEIKGHDPYMHPQ